MAPLPVDPSGGDGRGCARLGAGGTPALPGSHHPMTSSHQGHKIAEAFWCRLSLKKVYLSSCSFVCIRGSSSLAISRFSSNDPPHRGGRGPDSRANGSFPKGARRLSEKSPAGHPPPHRRDGIAWERGRPARILFLWPPPSFGRRRASVRCCRQPPCGREPHRPGRRRAMAPLPVDPSGGDGRGCARLGAGGTPALPGSHHPMTSSHQGHKIAEAFWCRLSLKEVHLSSCLFVLIRVHSWFFFINGRPFFLE